MLFFWILRLWYLSNLKFAVIPFPVPNQLYDHIFCPLFLKHCVSFRPHKTCMCLISGIWTQIHALDAPRFITPWLVTIAHVYPQKTHLLTFTHNFPIDFKFTDRTVYATLICKPLAEGTAHSVSAFSNHIIRLLTFYKNFTYYLQNLCGTGRTLVFGG